FFFFQAEDGIRDGHVTGVQTCALPICRSPAPPCARRPWAVGVPPCRRAQGGAGLRLRVPSRRASRGGGGMRRVAMVGAGMTPFGELFGLGIKDMVPMAVSEAVATVDKGFDRASIEA